jgi:hypothetical protein
MIAAVLLMLLQVPSVPAPTQTPTPVTLELGRRLAEAGTLASLLPMVAAKEMEELVAVHPELSAAEIVALRTAVRATYEAGAARLFAAEGRAYAERLSADDLRALLAYHSGPLAQRMRAAQPAAIVAAMTALDGFDLKKNSWTAFCTTTGRAC